MSTQTPIRLTDREYQIVRLLARGKLQKNIGVELGIGLNAVKTSLNRARRKVGANTTVQLVAMVVRKEEEMKHANEIRSANIVDSDDTGMSRAGAHTQTI